ncbi:MAG: hypothetical protein WC822_05695 [Candidatus Paceibacterota bacterium]|jgi:hypothetical protein
MLVANIIKKLENTPEATDIKIVAEAAKWGGYNVKLTCLIGDYYDFEVHEQISSDDHTHATNVLGFTQEKAIAQFKAGKCHYFATKPYHDENDLMSDYHAWSFHHKIKDIDWCVDMSRDRGGAKNARR